MGCVQSGEQRYVIPFDDKARNAHVEHYIPPRFPIDPQLTQDDIVRCQQSWELLRSGNAAGLRLLSAEDNNGIMTLFEEFYARLFERSEAFRGFFSSDVRKRGAILLRIIEQLTFIDVAMSSDLEKRFAELGRMHRSMNIRPWMFSVFIETLLESLVHCLGTDATFVVATSWTKLFSWALHKLLPTAIYTLVLETEMSQNYNEEELNKIAEVGAYSEEKGTLPISTTRHAKGDLSSLAKHVTIYSPQTDASNSAKDQSQMAEANPKEGQIFVQSINSHK